MNGSDFSNLRFNRPQRTIPGRVLWIGGLLIGVGLAWVALPPTAFFWLILLLIMVLGWAASYGWRHSARVLAAFLNHIQSL